MSFKKGVKLAAAIVVLIGCTVGHMIVSEKIGNVIGERMADWVNS